MDRFPLVLEQVYANVKAKSNPKIQNMALDCLYSLVWVYVIRIKGETTNELTVARLKTVCDVISPIGFRSALQEVYVYIFKFSLSVVVLFFFNCLY